MIIRHANDSDIPAMAAIRARDWETEPYWLARIGGYYRWEHAPQHAETSRGIFVAEDAGSLAGFVAGHRTRRYNCDGELQWINVVPEHRGQGIAGLLIVRMGEWFVENNLRRICVDVEPGNTVARKLYSRFGAVPFKPYWMIWQDARSMFYSPKMER